MILKPQEAVRIRHEGARVIVIREGQAVLDLPWGAALEIGKALIAQARKAEEIVEAGHVIADHALLTRLGVPVGLSNNPLIKAEAWKEAQWNTDLRRSIPRGIGIPSGEAVGTPTLSHKHKKGASNGQNGRIITR